MRYFLKFKTQGLDSRRHLLDFFLMATLACDFFPAFFNCAGIIMEITRPPSPQKNNGSCLRLNHRTTASHHIPCFLSVQEL